MALDDVHNSDSGLILCLSRSPALLHPSTTLLLLLHLSGGVTLTMVVIFLLGILATKAEPALNVLGDTVEALSGGKFAKSALIWSVCVGVAVGMCAGESYTSPV